MLDNEVVPVRLRTRSAPDVLATDESEPRLAWQLETARAGVSQLGYEVEVSVNADFSGAVSSGYVEASLPFDVSWPASELCSRDVRWCRVRVWTERGQTAWSAPLRIEAGLMRTEDWVARPISPAANVGCAQPVPVALVRKTFTVPDKVRSARIYVTSLGIHATSLNGSPISAALFDPGWSAYPQRLLYAAFDVTHLLQPGENVLGAAVGDGWWRGDLTWMSKRALYGETTALLAQLEIDLEDGSRLVIATDETWRGSTGGWLAADLYQGSTLDARLEPGRWREPGFDDRAWSAVTALPLPARLDLRSMSPVGILDTFDVEGVPAEGGKTLYDCGQNLTGWLRVTATGPAGRTITVRHAEVLDDDGRLYTAALRNARATDTYILDGTGTASFEPIFTFHGFRYAEIATDPDITIERVEVRVATSDVHPHGRFECSDPLLNKLWNNVRWSQLGNLLAIPTDCPQRDERMGWTGDIQVFAPTACMNSDVRAFLASWLKDLALEQRSDGCVPSVVPNVIAEHEFAFGAVGWGDAATLVPWALYEAYGDTQVLRDQYASMAAWVGWCASRLNPDGIWEGDFQLGDWLDPGAPPDAPQQATTSSDFIATAYLAHSAAVLARTARILGRGEDAATADALAQRVANAAWGRWREHALTTQTGCAIAIEFGIAPSEELEQVADRLAALVEGGDGRIATGFLGTPLVLPALTRLGRTHAAYSLLLNRNAPGWLYQVLHGATTTWERWDAIREDGSIHPGDMSVGEGSSMMSFNHYAYGAVVSWLYRSLAGIAPSDEYPGYAHIRFAPQPGGEIRFASARLQTPFGDAAIAWELKEPARLKVDLTIPPGASASFSAPQGWQLIGSDTTSDNVFLSGRHDLTLVPAIG